MAAPAAASADLPPPPPPLIGMVDPFPLLVAALTAALALVAPSAAAVALALALTWLGRELLADSGSMAGETVVITGAGSGIGRLVAHRLAHRQGCKLVLWDLNKTGVEATAKECEALASPHAIRRCLCFYGSILTACVYMGPFLTVFPVIKGRRGADRWQVHTHPAVDCLSFYAPILEDCVAIMGDFQYKSAGAEFNLAPDSLIGIQFDRLFVFHSRGRV